jgi:hypothetical protein
VAPFKDWWARERGPGDICATELAGSKQTTAATSVANAHATLVTVDLPRSRSSKREIPPRKRSCGRVTLHEESHYRNLAREFRNGSYRRCNTPEVGNQFGNCSRRSRRTEFWTVKNTDARFHSIRRRRYDSDHPAPPTAFSDLPPDKVYE